MTTSPLLDRVIDLLGGVTDPESGRDVLRLGMIRDLTVESGAISLTVYVSDPTSTFASQVEDAVFRALREGLGPDVELRIEADNAMIGFGTDVSVDGADAGGAATSGVLNTIAVASGKGGVGKSTVAVNLAVSLAAEGYEVGLVDTDIYGPSIPTMLGLESARPRVDDDRQIIPLEKYGVKLLSMGFLVDPQKAVVWRGPMVSGAVKQFLSEVRWGALDYLILDLPPGTGDIQLTIVQTVSLSGAVVVSTPQKVALADARKGVAMFDQVGVPVLGLVENMAWFETPDVPGKKYFLFGEGGVRSLAGELDVPLLAEVPLVPGLRESCDSGVPMSADSSPDSIFRKLARRVARESTIRNATKPRTERVEITRR